jgi:uncharacterized protein with PhoU and TrkA domain
MEVGEHIRRLEERLLQLNTQIMENSRDLAERKPKSEPRIRPLLTIRRHSERSVNWQNVEIASAALSRVISEATRNQSSSRSSQRKSQHPR